MALKPDEVQVLRVAPRVPAATYMAALTDSVREKIRPGDEVIQTFGWLLVLVPQPNDAIALGERITDGKLVVSLVLQPRQDRAIAPVLDRVDTGELKVEARPDSVRHEVNDKYQLLLARAQDLYSRVAELRTSNRSIELELGSPPVLRGVPDSAYPRRRRSWRQLFSPS